MGHVSGQSNSDFTKTEQLNALTGEGFSVYGGGHGAGQFPVNESPVNEDLVNGVTEAVAALRRAKLVPTQSRMLVAGLIFSGPTLALTASEVCERGADSGIHVSMAEAEHVLEELRTNNALPRLFASSSRPAMNLDHAARILQAMGNPHRLRVLRELQGGERCAGQLGQAVGLQPSALSQHLARLRADGLVAQRRSASRIYYSLAGDAAASVLRTLVA